MKALEFSRKSWHYRLATVYGPMAEYSVSKDMCSYFANVFAGILIAVLASIFGGMLVSVFLCDLVAWAAVCIIYGISLELSVLGTIQLVELAIAIPISIGFYINPYTTWRILGLPWEILQKAKSSSFIVNAYLSIKNKTCVPIGFSDNRH